MKTIWEIDDELAIRVYSSNFLGSDDTLVLHGGGNTSVKIDDTLYVKGSGWDLSDIKKEGFSPVELTLLQDMARVEALSDKEMVEAQKEAMKDKKAPNPSVEAILHAIIPFKYVDHTHADAIVTISNSKNGKNIIDELYQDFLIIPYVMPGFILAKTIYEQTKNIDWNLYQGIILHNHGIFTFDDNPQKSYEKMIDAVDKAKQYLEENSKLNLPTIQSRDFDTKQLIQLISKEKGYDVEICINQSQEALNYTRLSFEELTKGVLTPEHIIRTKRVPLVLKIGDDIEDKLQLYIDEYKQYFERFSAGHIMLNPAPNYVVIEDFAIISFGKTQKEANIINDIISHTIKAVMKANMLGGYQSISLKDSFDMEYWELEQMKLR